MAANVIRGLLLTTALCAPFAAHAQVVSVPLQSRNNLSELAANGASAQASSRLNIIANYKNFYAQDYGATCDGSASDSVAVSAAVSAAEAAAVSGNYWGVVYPRVVLPPGICSTDGTTVSKAIALSGSGPAGTVLALRSGNTNKSALTINVSQASGDPSPYTLYMYPHISDLRIDGNGSNQTGTSYALNFPDAGYSITTRYGLSAHMENVTVTGGKSGGVYLGSNRNGLTALNLITQNNSGAGLISYGYDIHLISGGSGVNTGNGIDFFGGGAIVLDGFNVYTNSAGGVNISQYVSNYVTLNAVSIDGNQTVGLYIDGTGASQPTVTMNGGRFEDNSASGDGAYSAVLINGGGVFNVNGTQFHNTASAPRVKYLVEQTGTAAAVSWSGGRTSKDGGGNAYSVGAFSNTTNIVGCVIAGADTCSVQGNQKTFGSLETAGALLISGITSSTNWDVQNPGSGTTYTFSSGRFNLTQNTGGGALGALTVKLPPSPIDGQMAEVLSVYGITSLAVQNSAGSGAGVLWAGTGLSAGQVLKCTYRSAYTLWICGV